jgi:threonine dehydrogenase-like Zn-dependent dehydrogenase
MATTSKAAVLLDTEKMEIQEIPIPEIGPDDGLLRVEVCGVCGADVAPYQGDFHNFFFPPVILGHEVVGVVERIGANAAKRWGVKEGDRIIIEEPLPCGTCDWCLAGHYQGCDAPRYGAKSTKDAPSLWGGYSEYMYLDPRALVHKMSPSVPLEIAPLFVPISNGIYWAQEIGGAGVGSTIVIQGPGQHGLGCTIAAKEAGCGCIIVLGLARDKHRLDLAKQFGAHYTIAIDEEDAVARVKEITGGRMASTVVNVTNGAKKALAMSLDLAGIRATIVAAGTAHAAIEDFMADKIMYKELTIKGVRGRYKKSLLPAISIIESGKYPLEKLATHTFTIDQTEDAIRTVAGLGAEDALHVSVFPK